MMTILLIIYQHSTLNIHNETGYYPSGVVSATEVFDFQANLIKNIFVDNIRFTKAEDMLFALEMNSEFVYNLLYERIKGKFAKATVNTSIIEALATVVLRCFDKDATEKLYLINLLTFGSPEVDRWKGMIACWELALEKQVPKNLFDLEEMHQNE